MTVDAEERELLAQLVLVAVVRVDVDRLSKKKRFVESVELLLDRLGSAFKVVDVATDLGFPLFPRTHNVLFHEPHVARRRLQFLQFVNEHSFELRFRHVDGPALTPAVVVRVMPAASLRPARRQCPPARLAANETLQREVRTCPLAWPCYVDASFKNCLDAVEGLFADKRLEIATARDPEFRHVNQARVQPIGEHSAEALGIHRDSAARAKAETRNGVEYFLFRKPARREFLEGALDQLAPFRVWHQALARPFGRAQVAEWRNERPAALVQRRPHSGARAFRSYVVVELRERREDAFHQLAGRRVVDRLGG